MTLPNTEAELLELIARETARMAYPGSMSRGIKPVVAGGTKGALERYFAERFPMRELWHSSIMVLHNYEPWHRQQAQEIARTLKPFVFSYNEPLAVGAKFLNTFMHQLMKYEPCRPVLPALHLPLDARVFTALRRLHSPSLSRVQGLLSHSPYSLPYSEHLKVQRALLDLMRELNSRPKAAFKVHSRIELNWLWVSTATRLPS